MKRLAVSLCALLVSLTVAVAKPELANAAPPPPCPGGDTYIFCIQLCPEGSPSLEQMCLAEIGNPPNCRVEQPFCYDMGTTCDGQWDYEHQGWLNTRQLWCPYQGT